MRLESLLAKKKSAIVKKWFNLVVDTYPPDTSRFLKSQKDPFNNPVGNTTLTGLDALFGGLFQGLDLETAGSFLDPIIRIRAVQNFTPSEATGFILALKRIVREEISSEPQEADLRAGLERFDERVDGLCLVAFDIYMGCREKIFQLQANEHRNRFFRAFERAGLVTENPDDAPGAGKRKLT